MKKYFVKALPEKGEIKKGEPYKHETLQGEVRFATADWSKETLKLYSSTKVKLFLCSRDIQSGDEITYIDGLKRKIHLKNFVKAIRLAYKDNPFGGTGHYKVVGEISPEALSYVKEGDEYDEDETKKAVITSHGWVSDDISLLDTHPDIHSLIFKIRGPCGYFH